MKILECEGIEKIYVQGKTSIRALQSVTLSVSPGEFVCISGRSGSGKTTLLNCIGTLDSVTNGSVALQGASIESLSEAGSLRVRREFFGFVFQQPRLFGYLSILDNVAAPLVYRGKGWKEAREIARKLSERLGLGARMDQPARLVSGGEAARASIARALVHRPKILLADEPTGELDTSTSREVVDLLAAQAKQGMAVIVATHDPIVYEKADRVLRLEDGRLV